jgi:ATP-dependent helicase/nuclease subunit B
MSELAQRVTDDLRALRARDPRGAVYLVVPSRGLGWHLRRRATVALGGVVNLHVLTLPDLADRIAGAALVEAGRRPLPPVAARVVVREALRRSIPADGYFAGVLAMPNFPDAVRRTLADLDRAAVTPAQLEASAPGEAKLAELAACARAVDALLAEHGYHDAWDLMAEATRLLLVEPARLGAAAVLVAGFTDLSPRETRLLAACRAAAPLREHPAMAGAWTPPAPDRIEIVAAPGEEREVRELARAILGHAAAGGRFDEVGVLLRQPDVYRSAIRDVFQAAGIPYAWGVGPRLGETRAGRSLALLVEARRSDFARSAVMEFLAFADLKPGPGVSPAEWERLSRQAGIVRGAREWRAGLERLDRRLDASGSDAAGDGDASEAGEAAGRRGDREALAALAAVSGRLVRGLVRLPPAGPLTGLLQGLTAVYRALVRRSPEAEQVLGALAGLAELAGLRPHVDLEELWGLAEAALAAPVDPEPEAPTGRVFVGELAQSLGLDFALTLVPGLVEGGFPAALREDPILLDEERRRLPGLPLAEAGRELERLRFQVAVAGAGRVVLSYPRVDAASGRPRVPSFFLLDLLERLTGRRHDFRGLERAAQHRRVGLGPVAEAAGVWPVDERDWQVSQALARRADPAALLDDLPGAARGLQALVARERTPALTAYDGLLPAGVDPGAAPLAPTWLETYATCPFKFFLGHVLGVAPVEEPDRVHTLSPADRGTLVHAALEAAYRELREGGLLPLDPARLADALAVLDGAFDAACERAERRGVTGLAALWAGERLRLRAELRAALAAEAVAAEDWVPAAFEVPFGLPGAEASTEPVPYGLADGTTFRFRGRIDRLDRSRDGSRARVVDYKSGRVRGGRTADRLLRGRALQLPIYRLAAAAWLQAAGTPATVEDAQYYHVVGRDAGARVRFTRAGWEERRADFDRVLALLAEGLRAGRFFALPERCAGRYPCDFDLACGAERARWAEAKLADPARQRHEELETIS